jgi:hypothetical protein
MNGKQYDSKSLIRFDKKDGERERVRSLHLEIVHSFFQLLLQCTAIEVHLLLDFFNIFDMQCNLALYYATMGLYLDSKYRGGKLALS